MLALLKLCLLSSWLAFAAAVALPAPSSSSPDAGLALEPAAGREPEQTTFGVCPTWTIRCVKDNDYPDGIVGALPDKKPFCFSFPRCYQCE